MSSEGGRGGSVCVRERERERERMCWAREFWDSGMLREDCESSKPVVSNQPFEGGAA